LLPLFDLTGAWSTNLPPCQTKPSP
jgi:hypothetical protein